MTFPDEFWWGTIASATQTEGASSASDWFRWEESGRAPRSKTGNGFTQRFDEDFQLLASFGLTHHQLSLDWSRLEPEPERHDLAAIEHYRAILTAAADHGISVWASLHHFALPGWFSENEGGFVDDRARSYVWPRHVDWVAETFGDLLFGWVPIYQPGVFVERGWHARLGPPNLADPEQHALALRATHLANFEAWRLLRSGDQPVMTIHDLSPVEPGVKSRHPDELDAARLATAQADHLTWSWTRALRDGVLEIPGLPPREIDDLAGSFDVIGFSYSGARTIYAEGEVGPYPADIRLDDTGIGPWTEGLGITIRRLADELPGRKYVVAGLGVGTSDDRWRTDVLRDALSEIESALADGYDIAGMFHHTGIDSYQWERGFDTQFGLFDQDRTPRASAELVKSWAAKPPNMTS
ncbi:MAG: family 1 glycosylhydrolase [Actinomycetes bacterium]